VKPNATRSLVGLRYRYTQPTYSEAITARLKIGFRAVTISVLELGALYIGAHPSYYKMIIAQNNGISDKDC